MWRLEKCPALVVVPNKNIFSLGYPLFKIILHVASVYAHLASCCKKCALVSTGDWVLHILENVIQKVIGHRLMCIARRDSFVFTRISTSLNGAGDWWAIGTTS